MRKALLVIAALAAATTLAAPSASAQASNVTLSYAQDGAAQPNASAAYNYSFRNHNSQKCVFVPAGDRNGAQVITCDRSRGDQLWNIEHVSNDPVNNRPRFRYHNVEDGLCLVVQGGAERTQAIQTTCLDYNDQYFYDIHIFVNGQDTGEHLLQNTNSGLCLVAQGFNDNAPVFQTPCWNGTNPVLVDQMWELV